MKKTKEMITELDTEDKKSKTSVNCSLEDLRNVLFLIDSVLESIKNIREINDRALNRGKL